MQGTWDHKYLRINKNKMIKEFAFGWVIIYNFSSNLFLNWNSLLFRQNFKKSKRLIVLYVEQWIEI